MKKRLFATLLCLIMVTALLPATAFAADGKATSVWIAGKQLTSTNPYYHNGDGGAEGTVDNNTETDYNAYFDADAGTLTLNGLSVVGSTATQAITGANGSTTFTYAIFADGKLDINVTADSAISTAAAGSGNANIALGIKGDVTFTGPAKLTATAGSGDSSVGVYVLGNLEVSGGTLTGNSGEAGGEEKERAESIGVNTMGKLTVSGGTLTGTGGTATAANSGISTGVASGAATVSGGSLTGKSNTATGKNARSYGAAVYGALTVNGGSLTAEGDKAEYTGSEEAYTASFGIYARATTIEFSGGKVTATGGTADDESLGIVNDGILDYTNNPNGVYKSGGAIAVSGTADVTAIGGAANGNNDSDSFGLWCRGGGLDVSGSGTLEAAGSTAKDDSYGIYVRAGDVTLNGKEVTAIGGEAVDSSYGVYAQDEATAISVSGGMFTAKTTGTSSSTKAALSKALSYGRGAKGSTSSDGSNPEPYSSVNNADYMWVSASIVSAPTFSPAGGSYTSAQSVTLTCMPEGAAIYYTTDGSEPTSSSTLYNAATPIEAALGTTIKAKAFKDGMTESETASATYALPEPTQIVIPLTIPDPSEPDTSGPDTTEPDTTDPVQTEYIVLEGADGVWTTGSAGGLTVIVDGDYEKFQSVSVDGEVIDSDKYTAEPGSTVVTLKAEYLQTLSVGSHTLRINFTDGYAETTFTVAEGESVSVPQTGDSGSTALWTALMLMGCACAFTACASLRKMRRRTAK